MSISTKKKDFERLIKENDPKSGASPGYAVALGASEKDNSVAVPGSPYIGNDHKYPWDSGNAFGNESSNNYSSFLGFDWKPEPESKLLAEYKTESDNSASEEQPYSYSRYLADAEKGISEYTEYLKQLAESEKADALEAADKEYQRASIDANAAYQRNLATYGAKGEALQKMGLTGSGYSDYLQGQAYSQMRNDVGLATSEKNAAEQAANKGYTNALREAEMYKNNKQMALNAEKGTYYDNLEKEAETKKQTAMSQVMTMAQEGATMNDINAYIASSGVSLNPEEIGAIESLVTARTDSMKAELIAQSLINGYDVDVIKAIANAANITLSEPEINEITTSIDRINSDAKSEEEKAIAFNIMTSLLSQEGGLDASSKEEVEALIKISGLDPTTGAGADIMKLYGGESKEGTNTGYEGGVVDSTNAGKILSGATAKKGNLGREGDGGNVTIKLNNKDYHLQRVDESPVKNSLETKLNDSFRLANNYSVEQWKQLPEEDIEGSVMYYNGKLYAYLESKNGKYGWFKLEARDSAQFAATMIEAVGGSLSTDYDKLIRKAKRKAKK